MSLNFKGQATHKADLQSRSLLFLQVISNTFRLNYLKITSKGQVTIPQHIRVTAGMPPNSEVAFDINERGEVVLKKMASVSPIRAALARVAGSANAPEFKGMTTDDYMRFVRGE